jgi:uncharacterized protein (DUF58 family)
MDRSRLFKDQSRPAGLRDYTPDSPFKTIAWRASARQGRLQVKTFEPTVTVQAALFLAVDSFERPAENGLFEVAVSVVASLANQLIEQRQPVGVFANGLKAGDGGVVSLGPAAGDDQRLAILESLARVRHAAQGSFDSFLADCTAVLPGRMTLCVVAARLSAEAIDRLATLRHHGHSVTALIVGGGALPDGRIASRRIDAADLGRFG